MSVRAKLWTREEYHRLVAAGAFPPESRVQLIQGQIVEMTPRSIGDALRRPSAEIRKLCASYPRKKKGQEAQGYARETLAAGLQY